MVPDSRRGGAELRVAPAAARRQGDFAHVVWTVVPLAG